MKVAAIGTIALGILLLVVSTIWTNLSGAKSSWTDEKAERSAQVQASIPALAGKVNALKANARTANDAATLQAELDALKKENEQLNAEFDAAANAPKRMSKILKWTGISLAVVGLLGWYAVNQTSS